jgi:hypothetical protein
MLRGGGIATGSQQRVGVFGAKRTVRETRRERPFVQRERNVEAVRLPEQSRGRYDALDVSRMRRDPVSQKRCSLGVASRLREDVYGIVQDLLGRRRPRDIGPFGAHGGEHPRDGALAPGPVLVGKRRIALRTRSDRGDVAYGKAVAHFHRQYAGRCVDRRGGGPHQPEGIAGGEDESHNGEKERGTVGVLVAPPHACCAPSSVCSSASSLG